MGSGISGYQKKLEELTNEITLVRSEIRSLKNERIEIIGELKDLRSERRKLINEFRELKERYNILNSKRKELVEKVRSLRKERREKLGQMKAILNLMDKKRRNLNILAKEVRIPISAIRKEIERLEWIQQTRPLTIEEENRIIREIARLEELLDKALKVVKRRKHF